MLLKITFVLFITLFTATGCVNTNQASSGDDIDKDLIVLAHGLGRSDWAMWKLAQRLEQAGYKVCSLDYATIGESVEAVLKDTTKQIDACIINSSKVHFVGHSLGGLVIRAYLQNANHTLKNVAIGNSVLIGTPNKGSELADHFKNSWLITLGGGISKSLVTGVNSLGNNLGELTVKFGVIAGTKSSGLTNDKFNGVNDGLVSVESTKLANMHDFITINVSHSEMRYNENVAYQTIHFLQKGYFKH